MKISREEVLKVAELAHLELAEDEVGKYREQLDAILTYVDKLKELDVSGTEPMAQVVYEAGMAVNPALRADCEVKQNVASAILEQAPEAKAPYFRVPKVIER